MEHVPGARRCHGPASPTRLAHLRRRRTAGFDRWNVGAQDQAELTTAPDRECSRDKPVTREGYVSGMLRTTAPGWLAVLLVLVSAGSLAAHHSLAHFDTTTAVRVTGTIVRIHLINPHSIIYLEQHGPDGEVVRWAVEGPSLFKFNRAGFPGRDVVTVGDTVEVCGYLHRDHVVWQVASADGSATSLAGRLINGEILVLADGTQHVWSDYGHHGCFAPGYTDRHSPR